ncbi:MAG: phosphoribulokinase, partial [Methylocella sp.]
MSAKYPIISVTGSSGSGTTSVRRTFEQIFRREQIAAAFIEGDAFHRYDRDGMQTVMAEEEAKGNRHFSHFGPSGNLLAELEAVFRSYHESGTGKTRHYV